MTAHGRGLAAICYAHTARLQTGFLLIGGMDITGLIFQIFILALVSKRCRFLFAGKIETMTILLSMIMLELFHAAHQMTLMADTGTEQILAK